MVAPIRPPPPLEKKLTEAERKFQDFYKDFLDINGDMYDPLLVAKAKLNYNGELPCVTKQS